MTDSLLSARKAAGTLTPRNYVVKTLVTTELMRQIADSYGALTAGDLLVGFKYIGGEMDRRGPQDFVFGAEESYGFLAGDHVRDKDAAVAALLLCELAARLKAAGKTLCEKLDDLFLRYGCRTESQLSLQMPGEKGMDDMKALMAGLRSHPPAAIAGMKVALVRDYLRSVAIAPGGEIRPLAGPVGDLLIFDLEPAGNCAAIRPSGTEPKVKFYMFAFDPPGAAGDLAATKAAQARRLRAMEADLRVIAASGTASGAVCRRPRATLIQPSSITNCVIVRSASFGSVASRWGVMLQGVFLENAREKTPRRMIWAPVLSRGPMSCTIPSRTNSADRPLTSGR